MTKIHKISIADIHGILHSLPHNRRMATLFALETGLEICHVTTLKWSLAHQLKPELSTTALDVLRMTPINIHSKLVFWEDTRKGISPLLGLRADIEHAANMSWKVLQFKYRYAIDVDDHYDTFKRAALLDMNIISH